MAARRRQTPGEEKRARRSPKKEKGKGERASARKDRLIQTRVPEDLETTLKEEAKRRRLTVSHLIRNILEDAFDLVDGVVADVDQIVTDSVTLARNVKRGAQRIGSSARRAAAEEEDDLDEVWAWNPVVVNRDVACTGCGAELSRGDPGWAGISDQGGPPRAWLCSDCADDWGVRGEDPGGPAD